MKLNQCAAFLVFWGGVSCLAADGDVSKQYFAAIRGNDLAGLRALVAQGKDVNARGDRESTPLIYASGFGSADAVKILLDAKADVNASNALGMTALLFGVTEPEKAKLLVEHGADVNAKTKTGRTPLIVSAMQNHSDAVVKMLLAKGADLKAADKDGMTFLLAASGAGNFGEVQVAVQKGADVDGKDASGTTALMNAAGTGDLATVEFLIAKGADVNAMTSSELFGEVKNGKIRLGKFTPLMLASVYGPPAVVEALLRAGARVDAQDVRGFTPLVYAVSAASQNPAIVAMLLKAGAKTDVVSLEGETPAQWAQKYSVPEVTRLLKVSAVASVGDQGKGAPDSRVAVERSLKLLNTVSDSFINTGGCMSCHAQNLTAFVSHVAQQHGYAVDAGKQAGQANGLKAFVAGSRDGLLVRQDPPGGMDTLSYMTLHLSAAGIDADMTTDAIIHNLAAQQTADGGWHSGGMARAPMEDGDITHTALAVKAFQQLGWEGRRADLARRVKAAQDWLLKAKPVSSEDCAMQILGLKWSGTDAVTIQGYVHKVVARQREDGGWAQSSTLSSDAYGTGQTLYALAEGGGVKTNDSAFQRGVRFLLKTQHEDGSWHVKTRSLPFQPYFQSGFPYDHDQWISMAGTAWAAAALAVATEPTTEKVAVALR
jgi:ankyrin repeat protein